ncbi:fibro-slime domain-containing protein [Lacticaseibacillus pabuli]|uniref:Fibro-slime domain-containing protein n=1 Tax=Lacticaseibacillus pabuli TaxID=3025672 RepID=A0ABY7WZL8_9LACO|nr:fibro-slime domain-containing protein [Lacticaseibacillus sp. KACC 23028]WDF83335.1 fibro-slime domain-containing protein [Lacticaseibacillus sp. KACC 23028]
MENKTHYKMYKAGKQWLFAAIAVSTLCFAGIASTANAVSADDTGTAAQAATTPADTTAAQVATEAAATPAPAATTTAPTATETTPTATPASVSTRSAESAPVVAPAEEVSTAPKAAQVEEAAPVVKAVPVTEAKPVAATEKKVEAAPVEQDAEKAPVVAKKTNANEVHAEITTVKKAEPVDTAAGSNKETVTSTAGQKTEGKAEAIKEPVHEIPGHSKSYIMYEDVEDDNHLHQGRIFVATEADTGTEYHIYDEATGEFVEATPEYIAEIKAAYDATVTSKDYLTDGALLSEALDAKSQYAGQFKIVHVDAEDWDDELPEDVARKVTAWNQHYAKPRDNKSKATEGVPKFYIKDDEDNYYWIEADGDEFGLPLTDEDKTLLEGNSKTGYATETVIAALEAYWEANDQTLPSVFQGFKVHRSTKRPEGVDGKNVIILSETTRDEFQPISNRADTNGFTQYTVYKDGNKYYSFDKDKGIFTELTGDDLERAQAADKPEFMQVDYLKDKSGDDTFQKLIAAAVASNLRYLEVDGVIYRINHTTDENSIPEGATGYTDLEPDAEEATEIPDTANLATIETTNPGVLISLNDYWFVDKDGTEKPIGKLSWEDMGINIDNSLVFSTGAKVAKDWWNHYDETGATQGIVESQLGPDGYPVVAYGKDKHYSLEYLFNGDESKYKEVLVKKETLPAFISDGRGNYSLDPQRFHVQYDEKNGFTTYNKPNYLKQFFPLDGKDEFFNLQGNAEWFDNDADLGKNHYFGMEMDMHYVMPEGGKLDDGKEMIFEFTGDDDFWLFIDGKLVIDIGGIHSKKSGKIDFSTGKVTYPDSSKTTDSNLETLLGPKWNVPNEQHEMKIFYLERGNKDSNLLVNYNLQFVNHYYATKSSYAHRTQVDAEYAYADRQETVAYQTPAAYAFAAHENYGVAFTKDLVTPPGGGTTDPEPGLPGEPDPELPETPGPETPEPETPEPGKPDPEVPGMPETGGSVDELPDTNTPAKPAPTAPKQPTQTANVAGTPPVAKPVQLSTVTSGKVARGELPQTGNVQTKSASVLGMMGMLMSLFGLSGVLLKKRHRN